MAKTGPELAEKFFPGTGRSYDRVVRMATLGLDRRWKERLLGRMPRAPDRVLELASGTGILTEMLLDRFPAARVTCVDLTDDYQVVARGKIAARGATNVEFRLGNAETIALGGPYDAVASSYVPKYCDPGRLASNIDRALAPGGVVLLHDFNHPRGVVPRAIWRTWFAILNLAAPRVWPEWAPTFDCDLSDLIRTTTWPKDYREAFARLGYEAVGRDHLTSRAATIVHARKPAVAR